MPFNVLFWLFLHSYKRQQGSQKKRKKNSEAESDDAPLSHFFA